MTEFEASDRDVNRAIRSWLHADRHEDASRLAGAVLDEVDAIPQRRAIWWPAWRTPVMSRFVSFGLGAASVAVLGLVIGSQLLDSPGNPGRPTEPSGTPAPSKSRQTPLPAEATFTSRIHGISIDYPAGWQIRRATESWTEGELDFDAPAADVIFDPTGPLPTAPAPSAAARPTPDDPSIAPSPSAAPSRGVRPLRDLGMSAILDPGAYVLDRFPVDLAFGRLASG